MDALAIGAAVAAGWLAWRGRPREVSSSSTVPEVRLRLIFVTDVYMLDHLPSLATLKREQRCGRTLVCLPGDFLAPSMLFSIDHGFGHVDLLILVGVTHVCFGNHEADVPHKELQRRIRQFHGTWLNSNMPDLADAALRP